MKRSSLLIVVGAVTLVVGVALSVLGNGLVGGLTSGSVEVGPVTQVLVTIIGAVLQFLLTPFGACLIAIGVAVKVMRWPDPAPARDPGAGPRPPRRRREPAEPPATGASVAGSFIAREAPRGDD